MDSVYRLDGIEPSQTFGLLPTIAEVPAVAEPALIRTEVGAGFESEMQGRPVGLGLAGEARLRGTV